MSSVAAPNAQTSPHAAPTYAASPIHSSAAASAAQRCIARFDAPAAELAESYNWPPVSSIRSTLRKEFEEQRDERLGLCLLATIITIVVMAIVHANPIGLVVVLTLAMLIAMMIEKNYEDNLYCLPRDDD